MKKIKNLLNEIMEWPASSKIFIFLAIISLIGIILRWDHVKKEAQRGFDYFKTQAADTGLRQ